jgi:hypothetical protein
MKTSRSTSSSSCSDGGSGGKNKINTSKKGGGHPTDPHHKRPPVAACATLGDVTKSHILLTRAASSRTSKTDRLMVHVKRRPVKKRMRPEAPIHYERRQVVPPFPDKRNITTRQPETLQEEFSVPNTIPGRRNANNMSFFLEKDGVLGLVGEGSIDSNVVMSVVADDDSVDLNLAVVTPPQLKRQVARVFPRTGVHKTSLEKETIALTAAGTQTLLQVSTSAAQSSNSEVPFPAQDSFKIPNNSKQNDKKSMKAESHDDGREIWSDTGRGNEFAFFASFDAFKRPPGYSSAASPPPQLVKSESDMICSMMQGLLEAAPTLKEPESPKVLDNTDHKRQLPDIPLTPPRTNSSMQDENDSEDILMKEAVATMQQPIIETPKRMFRRKKSSFSSFASSASGSSRSSCVTPSPAKRMMSSSFSNNFGTSPFGHRFSRSMGSLDGFSEPATHPSGLHFMESAPATLNIQDRAKGVEAIHKSRTLTEQEKVQQTTMMLLHPLQDAPKKRFGRPSQNSYRNHGLQPRSEAWGTKWSFGNASYLARYRPSSAGRTNTPGMPEASVARLSEFLAPNQRFSALRMRHLQQKQASNDELAFPSLPMRRDSKTGASLIPRPVSAKTWAQTQQEMFNPYTFENTRGDRDDTAKVSTEKSTISPRRISQL